jgi:plastocyanin
MRKVMITLGAVLLLALSIDVATGASPSTVAVRGAERFVPNAMIQSTFRFSPGSIRVTSGEEVTWVDEGQSAAPHTVTVVAELPGTIDEVFGCQGPGQPCGNALAAHGLAGGEIVPVVEVGNPGLDSVGDSLLFFPGGSVSAVVSAPAGTTLLYLCALHPWMQGSISVA